METPQGDFERIKIREDEEIFCLGLTELLKELKDLEVSSSSSFNDDHWHEKISNCLYIQYRQKCGWQEEKIIISIGMTIMMTPWRWTLRTSAVVWSTRRTRSQSKTLRTWRWCSAGHFHLTPITYCSCSWWWWWWCSGRANVWRSCSENFPGSNRSWQWSEGETSRQFSQLVFVVINNYEKKTIIQPTRLLWAGCRFTVLPNFLDPQGQKQMIQFWYITQNECAACPSSQDLL